MTLRRWKRVEYDRLVELGAFDRDPVELIGGHLIVAEPKGSRHATAVGAADDALRAVLPVGWIVRNQDPVAFDRTIKGSLYARAGVADYWIVDLVDDVLEVYRDSVPDPAAPCGWAYASRQVLERSAQIAPLAIPSAQLSVADLF